MSSSIDKSHFEPDFGRTHRDAVLASRRSPAYQAYQVLYWGFVVAPAIAGLDKFGDHLCHWEKYLSPLVLHRYPYSAHSFMMIVGVVEIVAALIVAMKPRIGAYVLAVWFAAIIANLFLLGNFYDIALRDFVLFLGAIALGQLSMDFDGGTRRTRVKAS